MEKETVTEEAVALLSQLIKIPRTSRNEKEASDLLVHWMTERGLNPQSIGNNILAVCNDYNPERDTILLNAHIDTVKPAASWSRDPFTPVLEGDMLYGIGSNDCGGGLVSLLQVFRILHKEKRDYNILFLASCEEEVSGTGGIRSVIPLLPKILSTTEDVIVKRTTAIVGEPTGMLPAVAEKGLMVLDIVVRGVSGHAARNEGVNAIYSAIDDMIWLRDFRFPRVSPFLGPVKMTLTVMNSGTQHNVIPDECRMVVDIRSNECYTNEEIFSIVSDNIHGEVKARSFHLRSSHIPEDHTLVERCKALQLKPFGSPTLSDQALMPWCSMKIGPGDSSRSHSADEFIRVSEIRHAITTYLKILQGNK